MTSVSPSSDENSPLRRAELLAALSLAADLGTGLPLENAQRTAILTVALGRAAEVTSRDLKDAYYLALLRYVGCTADAPIEADVFGGDEIAARGWLARVDWSKPRDVVRVVARNVAAGKSALQRARLMARVFVKMPRLTATAESRCEVAQSIADDLGCSVRVREALGYSFERWDGKGLPRKKKGGAIPLAMRLVQVADDAQAFHRVGGVDGVTAMLAERAGKALDPTLAEALRAGAAEVLGRLEVSSVWDAAIAGRARDARLRRRHGDRRRAAGDGGLRGSEVVVHAGPLERRRGAGGGRGGAARDAAGGRRRGAPRRLRARRRARGRVGRRVGEGRAAHRGRMGEGADARPLHGADPGAAAAARAAGHAGSLDHERMDGSGYPHRHPAASLPSGARLLQAADMYQAMRETRPHRRSIPREEVAATMEKEVEKGRLDRDAVRAVLEAAGHRVGRVQARGSGNGGTPGGLSDPRGRGAAAGVARADQQGGRAEARGLGARGGTAPGAGV